MSICSKARVVCGPKLRVHVPPILDVFVHYINESGRLLDHQSVRIGGQAMGSMFSSVISTHEVCEFGDSN